MREIVTVIIMFIGSAVHAQWQYVNPTALASGIGSSLLQTSVIGRTGGNNFYNNTWLYGTSVSNDWTTTKLIDGISVDASFQTANSARTWWMRDPVNSAQSWGDGGNTFLTIKNGGNVGIGITSPSGLLHLRTPTNGSFWSSYNYGANVIIDGPRHNAIAFLDAGSSNPFAIANVSGKLTISKMPSLGDVSNPPTELFTINNSNGSVGIGTANTSSKLDVHNGATNIITTGLNVYRNSDPNLGIKLLTGIGDDASYGNWNGGIGSWNGIGFHSTLDNVTRGVFNARTGDFSLKGNIKAEGTGSNYFLGNVGIGSTDPKGYKLAVAGKAIAEEVTVKLQANWPDYVFEPTYILSPLDSIKTYIDKNKHLPEVPSAKEMEKNGVNLGEMNMLLLKKIEELTLYVIEQQRENKKQSEEIKELKKLVKK